MKKTMLFAIDPQTEEIIVSESEKGSNKIKLIERIERNKNELLYDTVGILTQLSNSADLDIAIFKAIDKVCQMVYDKHVENKR
jgi:recombinational DNA repair protein (RecF pathway)